MTARCMFLVRPWGRSVFVDHVYNKSMGQYQTARRVRILGDLDSADGAEVSVNGQWFSELAPLRVEIHVHAGVTFHTRENDDALHLGGKEPLDSEAGHEIGYLEFKPGGQSDYHPELICHVEIPRSVMVDLLIAARTPDLSVDSVALKAFSDGLVRGPDGEALVTNEPIQTYQWHAEDSGSFRLHIEGFSFRTSVGIISPA